MPVDPIPAGYHSITPALCVKGGAAAIEFYKQAFGAKELMRMMDPTGTVLWHAEMQIGDSRFMLGEEMPEWNAKSPTSLGGSPVVLHVYVPDVDAAFAQAVAAGAKVVIPLADQFYGDRSGRLSDPFGHLWVMSTHKEDLSDEEIARRGAEWAEWAEKQKEG